MRERVEMGRDRKRREKCKRWGEIGRDARREECEGLDEKIEGNVMNERS